MVGAPFFAFFYDVGAFLAVCVERFFLKVRPIFLSWRERPLLVMFSERWSISSGRVMSGVWVRVVLICWVLEVSLLLRPG